jgi:nucleotide-binding universal stress UspA family protein
MPHVTIAYDGSDAAKSAVRTAAGLLAGADAVIVHVYEEPPGPAQAVRAGAVLHDSVKESFDALARETAEQATTVAEQGRALAAEAGMSAESKIVPSRQAVWHETLTEAAMQRADIIACGTRGHGTLGRAVLGSVSSSLVHQADRPILIVPAGEHDLSGPIVIGYDGSEDARSAIATVSRLLPGRETVLVHVWNWPVTDSMLEHALLPAAMVRDASTGEALKGVAEEAARRIAEEGREVAQRNGMAARVELREATEGTWRVLSSTAADLGAAVLVAGSRGLGGLQSALLGSVSSALAHHAERPTMIVRPAG